MSLIKKSTGFVTVKKWFNYEKSSCRDWRELRGVPNNNRSWWERQCQSKALIHISMQLCIPQKCLVQFWMLSCGFPIQFSRAFELTSVDETCLCVCSIGSIGELIVTLFLVPQRKQASNVLQFNYMIFKLVYFINI